MTASTAGVGARYEAATTRSDVLALLRADYLDDADVRRVVDDVVAELAFLGRTHAPFARLGVRSPPRGMRWWWQALTGEAVTPAPPPPAVERQLRIEDVYEGYGDEGPAARGRPALSRLPSPDAD